MSKIPKEKKQRMLAKDKRKKWILCKDIRFVTLLNHSMKRPTKRTPRNKIHGAHGAAWRGEPHLRNAMAVARRNHPWLKATLLLFHL